MRSVIVILCVALLAVVVSVDGITVDRLHAVLQANSGLEATGHVAAGGDFIPPRVHLCVMYDYNLRHNDDSNFPELQSGDVGQLPDGTTYGKDPYHFNKPLGYTPCVLVNLEGDLVNTRGEVKSKFRLGGNYPNPPCLGATKSGLFGTKNSAGHSCTPVASGDKIWIDRNPQWYPSPTAIPPQAAQQRPMTPVAPSQLPRQRVCVLYDYNLRHNDDSNFPEYQGGSADIGVSPGGSTYGKWNRYPAKNVWSPCTFANLEGDLLDVKGNVISKFKLGGSYPTPPCLGTIKTGLMGGYKNILGHSCTPPVGADAIWTDWTRATWYPSPQAIPK